MAHDILNKIILHKKEEVAAAKRRVPEIVLKQNASLPKERRSLIDALKEPGKTGVNIIAEIKRQSPSKGPLRPDLDSAEIAKKYEEGGAAGISVLTDFKYFMGSFDDMIEARRAVELPVLRKDFIVDEYQIYESAVLSSDAILIIVRVLSATQLKDYIDLTREIGLESLVEVHTEEDVEIANAADAKLVGINNRNLKTFETDINQAISMAALLGDDQIPVALSGISSRADIDRNLETGIHNFLVGESLVKARDPKAFLQELLRPSTK